MGWMTLHSVSLIYPETPTPYEQQLVSQWLDLFQACITCPSCRDHFAEMLGRMRALFPTMLRSRADFAEAMFRAHNTVNRRLDKPVYGTLHECMEVYRGNVKVRTARDYRYAYLTHIRQQWSLQRDALGIAALRKVGELYRIENEYWTPRDTGEIPVLNDAPVPPLPRQGGEASRSVAPVPPRLPMRFVGGRFRFGNQ